MMAVNVQANTGLKSIGFNIVPTVINPWAPVDITNRVTTSNSLQPAYDAPNMNTAGIIDAIRMNGNRIINIDNNEWWHATTEIELPRNMNVRRAFVTLIPRFAIIQSHMQPADNETTKLSIKTKSVSAEGELRKMIFCFNFQALENDLCAIRSDLHFLVREEPLPLKPQKQNKLEISLR